MQPNHLSTKIMIISRVKTSLLLCSEKKKKKQFQDFELVIFHDTIIWKFESDFVGLSSDTQILLRVLQPKNYEKCEILKKQKLII